MVYFVCHHCNSSLKKQAVEKHFKFNCVKSPALSCIDCCKDFFGDDYQQHITCVSEAERYGGPDFVPKKVAVKQNKWLEACEETLSDKSLAKDQKALVQKLLEHQNIPRIRKKFYNFVSNVAPNYRQKEDLLNSVFDAFEKNYKQSKQNQSDQTLEDKSVSEREGKIDLIEKTEENNVEGFLEVKSKNKKHKKEKNDDETLQDSNDKHNMEQNCLDQLQLNRRQKQNLKKLKKGNENIIPISEERINNFASCENFEDGRIKNKKKKKKHKEILSEGDNVIDNKEEKTLEDNFERSSSEYQAISLPSLEGLSKKERKRKLKELKYEAELKSIGNTKTNDLERTVLHEEETKSKRKKMKLENNFQDKTITNRTNIEKKKSQGEEDCSPEEIKEICRNKFNWSDTIIAVLKCKSGGEMSLKRLGKKVLMEYQSRKGPSHETYEKLLAKFNKKVKKTVGVRVLKDNAKLISDKMDN